MELIITALRATRSEKGTKHGPAHHHTLWIFLKVPAHLHPIPHFDLCDRKEALLEHGIMPAWTFPHLLWEKKRLFPCPTSRELPVVCAMEEVIKQRRLPVLWSTCSCTCWTVDALKGRGGGGHWCEHHKNSTLALSDVLMGMFSPGLAAVYRISLWNKTLGLCGPHNLTVFAGVVWFSVSAGHLEQITQKKRTFVINLMFLCPQQGPPGAQMGLKT